MATGRGNPMMGFGRGGRGKLLMELLNQPVRKPGQPTSQPKEQQSPPKEDPSTPASQSEEASLTPSLMPAMGRGLTKALLTSQPSPPASQPTPPTTQAPRVPGRGQPNGDATSEQQVPASVGRAAMLKQQPTQLRAPQQRPGRTGGTGPAPSEEMAGLSLDPSFKKGSSGTSVPLSANYLMLKAEVEGIYQYHVYFEPNVENKRMRFRMISSLGDLLGKTRCFDGTILFLPKKITDDFITRSVVRDTDGADITVTIKNVAVVQSPDRIKLFNIIFHNVQRALELTQIGRNYYDPKGSIPLPQHKMELWPGYITSIHEQDGGLLMCFDASHRLLRTDTAYEQMGALYASCKGNFHDAATKQLVGCVVLTRYNNRTYRIDEIDWDKNPQSTFLNHQGEAISFIDYYKRHYGLAIKDLEQPLLIHRPKRKARDSDPAHTEEPQPLICLVPELCYMTGLTDSDRADFRVMKDIANFTRVVPQQRQEIFKKFVERVNTNEKARDILANWGLQLDPRMVTWEGRKLPVEKIHFGKTQVLAGEEADWGRDAVKSQLISTIPLRNWIVVVTKRDSGKAMDFIQMMKKVSLPMGMEVADAKVLEIHNDRTDTYLNAIRQQIGSHLQLVVTIFPTSRDDRYSALKKLCCIDSPVPSQVINARTISQQQKLRSVTQKIALQINCKLGGELWALEIPLKNLMIVGIDVYHDSTFGQKKSVVGFVASTNRNMSRWYSRVVIQGQRQEIMDGLKMCFQAALKNYHKVNEVLPDRIIVFRDGVGDGQMYVVKEYEAEQLRQCFSMFGDTYAPKMSIVVVQKRISTRIFRRGGAQSLSNPHPGTVADHTITRKSWYDFFLVSQHVRQGTVTPTHYVVVSDNSGLKPDHMQRLTYKMTHMYYNWPGTIRVPAPCQYAHKLAFLVGQSLHREPSVHLSDRLFFL